MQQLPAGGDVKLSTVVARTKDDDAYSFSTTHVKDTITLNKCQIN